MGGALCCIMCGVRGQRAILSSSSQVSPSRCDQGGRLCDKSGEGKNQLSGKSDLCITDIPPFSQTCPWLLPHNPSHI